MAKYTNSGTLTTGLILIAFGAIFLVENVYAPFSAWQLITRYWPVCLVIIGLNKIFAYFVRSGSSRDITTENAPSKEQSILREHRPSLINALLWTGLGVLFLLSNFGAVPDVWILTKRYWPVLLIFLGAGKVVDYFFRKSSMSIRFGEFFGLVGILILGIAFTYLSGVLFTKNSDFRLGRILGGLPLRIGNVSVRPEQWLGNSHAFMEEKAFPLEGLKHIRIENSQGKVSVIHGNDREVRVRLKKVIYADEARARDLAGRIRVEGERESPAPDGSQETPDAVFVVRTNRESVNTEDRRIETDMEILVPKNSQLQVRNSFGSVEAVGIDGTLDLSTTHRDLEVRDCKGRFIVNSRYGECRLVNLTGNIALNSRSKAFLQNIRGDVTIKNEFSPTEISQVDGRVTVDISEGELKVEDVSKPVTVYARGTEVSVARLQESLKIEASHRSVRVEDIASDVSLDSRYANVYLKDIEGGIQIQSDSDSIQADTVNGNLTMQGRGSGIRVNDAVGRLNIRTTLKDVIVGEFSGSCSIENEYAGVSLSLSDPVRNDVNIKNRNGGIDLFLPEGADFSLNAVARQGKVESFYSGLGPAVTTGDTGTLESNKNSDGARIRLVTEYGNIRIYGGGRRETTVR